MAEAINYLLDTPAPCTVFFIVGEEQERIEIVKTLVAKHSPVFNKMLFESEMKETGDVIMPDIYPDALKIYLKFAYGVLEVPSMSEQMTGWSLETCLHVVDFTEKYEVPQLQVIALSQLKPTGVDNLFPALHCFTLYETPTVSTLADDVQKIVVKNTSDVLQHPSFLDVSLQSLLFILSQDTLLATEVDLWKATVSWAKHQGKTDNVEKLKLLMKKPLQHIRLLTMSLEDIYNTVEPSKLFSLIELVDITKAIINKTNDIRLCSNNMNYRKDCFVLVSLHHNSSRTYYSNISSYIVKTKDQRFYIKSILCLPLSEGSFTTSVRLKIYEKEEFKAERRGLVNCDQGEDIVILPEAFNWPPIELKPHSEYRLELTFGQTVIVRNGLAYCYNPERRPQKLPVWHNSMSPCVGHSFKYGEITCTVSRPNYPYLHIKELDISTIP